MVDPQLYAHHHAHWYPTAAYLYILWLDALALAWEYLRRHPDYRLDWLRRHRRPQAAQSAAHRWGLRLLEDPALDARDAHPAWLPGSDSVVQLYPDADPPVDAAVFAFWAIPGYTQLLHDGKGLALIARSPGRCLRYALAPGLEDGMAVAYAHRGRGAPHVPETPASMARPRPPPAALLELHTLQALDATLAGASLHQIAEGLFGVDAAAGWYSDGGLRSKVRRLVRRGDSLMRGGYRRLAQLPPLEKGRFEGGAKRP
jgi:hypothetical protein